MRVAIALGSNLGDRHAHLRAARERIAALPGVRGLRSAALYESEPVDCPPGAGTFLNSVVEAEYDGAPAALLPALLAIERALGRPGNRPRNDSRAIDLDLLHAGDLTVRGEVLTLPHPRLAERRFALAPLADLSPALRLPGHPRTVAELLTALDDDLAAVRRVATAW